MIEATPEAVDTAFAGAVGAAPSWAATPPAERAASLRRAADLLEARMPTLVGLIVREAGKTLADAIGEVREAVDFLRYYSGEIARDFDNATHRRSGPVVASARGTFRWRSSSGRSPPRWRPAMSCWRSRRRRRR